MGHQEPLLFYNFYFSLSRSIFRGRYKSGTSSHLTLSICVIQALIVPKTSTKLENKAGFLKKAFYGEQGQVDTSADMLLCDICVM
jgi:hypothetical protein